MVDTPFDGFMQVVGAPTRHFSPVPSSDPNTTVLQADDSMSQPTSPDPGAAPSNPFDTLPIGPTGRPRITIRPNQTAQNAPPSPGNSAIGPTVTTESGDPINNTGTVPYVAGADETTPDYSHIDKRVPQYSDRVLDANGIPADLYKYLNIHEQTERPLMDKGMPYDQAHKIATQREQQAVQADGVDWGTYQGLMDEYAKKTESGHITQIPPGVYPGPYEGSGRTPEPSSQVAPNAQSPLANAGPDEPSMPGPQAPTTPGDVTPQDVTDMAHEFTRAELVRNKTFGGITPFLASLNQSTLDSIVSPAIKGLNTMGAGQMQMEGTMMGFDQFGYNFLRDANQKAITGEQMFDMMNIPHYDSNTYASDAGKATLDLLATSLGIYGGARYLTAKLIESGVPLTKVSQRVAGLAAQKYTEAIHSDPVRWIVSEILGAAGATMGGEAAQDTAHQYGANKAGEGAANIMGAIGGAVAGAGGAAALTMQLSKMGLKVSQLFARKAQEAANALSHLTGLGTEAHPPEFGMTPPKVQVDPDVLADARHAETRARAAGDNVVQARINLDRQTPQTGDWLDAQARMFDAQRNERVAVAESEKAWSKIPAEVRGQYTQQQNALRAQFAETQYPTTFAKNQVEAETSSIDAKVKETFDSLKPEDMSQGVAGYSAKISDGIWGLRDQAKGMLDKYWNRTPLKQQMPRGPVLKALDRYLKNGTDIPDEAKPLEDVATIQQQFGNIKNKTPLSWLKNEMTLLHQKANDAYRAGNALLGGQYDTLHKAMYDTVADAFPDNVALQQARDVSTKYFDYFTRSELGKFLRDTKTGAQNVHEEDVLTSLVNRARGFNDLAKAIDFLDKKGVVKVSDPEYVSKEQRANIESLKDNVTQGLRAHLQDYFQKVGMDPAKSARYLNSPEFQARIKAFAPALAEAQNAGEELNKALTRRTSLQQSALAKYLEFGDPDVAINKVWNNNDPAALAKGLMDGVVGVGGFRTDPLAMEGFKSALLDKLVNTSLKSVMSGNYKGQMIVDFGKISDTLSGVRGRLLKSVLNPDEWERLNRMVERGKTLEAGLASKEKSDAAVKWLAQYGALHLQRFLPHVGEGGELKKASLVSGIGGQVADNFLQRAVPPGLLFKGAISNPELEQIMYNKVPIERAEIKEFTRALRRGTTFERSVIGFYNNWYQYGDGPQGNPPQAENNTPYSWVDQLAPISSANAATTQSGQPYDESAASIKTHNPPPPGPPQNYGPRMAGSGDTPIPMGGNVVRLNANAGRDMAIDKLMQMFPGSTRDQVQRAISEAYKAKGGGGGGQLVPFQQPLE